MKQQIIKNILAKLEDELQFLENAAKSAHSAAIDSEAKAESQYDTRAIEASYLAEAQANRVLAHKKCIASFRALADANIPATTKVRVGCLISLQADINKRHYLLASEGGGMQIKSGAENIIVVTPAAPIGALLLDKEVGDEMEISVGGKPIDFQIIKIE